MEEIEVCHASADFLLDAEGNDFFFCSLHAAEVGGNLTKTLFKTHKKCDISVFRERYKMIEQLTMSYLVLQHAYDEEKAGAILVLNAAKERMMQLVDWSFAELAQRVENRYEHCRQEIESSVGRLINSKTVELSNLESKLLAGKISFNRVLISAVEEKSVEVVALIQKMLTIREESVVSTIARTPEEMNSAIDFSQYFEESLVTKKRLCKLLTPVIDESTLQTVIDHYRSTALPLPPSDCKKRTCLEKAVGLLNARYPHAELTAETSFRLGKLLLERYRLLPQSRQHLKNCVEIERIIHPQSTNFVQYLSLLGRSWFEEGNVEAAMSCFREAVAIGQFNFQYSEVTFMATALLASTMVKTERVEAEKLLHSIISTNPDEFSESAALATKLLADLARYSSSHSDAEYKYKSAISIFSASHPNSIHYISALGNLGLLYDIADRHREALVAYEKCLEVATRLRPDTISVGLLLNNTALVHESLGDDGKAEALFLEAWKICEKVPGNDILADTCHNLGRFYQKTNRLGDAEKMYMRAVYLLRTYLPNSVYISESLWLLGNSCSNNAKWGLAESGYLVCLTRPKSLEASANIQRSAIIECVRSIYSR